MDEQTVVSTEPQILLDLDPAAEDIAVLGRGLAEYNRAFVPSPVRQTFALFLRDWDGVILGGIEAQHIWRTLYLHRVWLSPTLRGTGQGRRLMLALEAEARARNVGMIWLETMNWQARGFYEKLGFTAFAELPHPAPSAGLSEPVSIFMTKRL